MKAQEVLQRYAAGERNFYNANLRGANFKGKDLSGANFRGADIRSANFTDATLRNANFSEAHGGVRRRWVGVHFFWIAVFAGFSSIMQSFWGALAVSSFFNGSIIGLVIGCTYVLLLMVIFVALAFQGFTVRAFKNITNIFRQIAVSIARIAYAGMLVGFAVAVVGVFAGVEESAFLIILSLGVFLGVFLVQFTCLVSVLGLCLAVGGVPSASRFAGATAGTAAVAGTFAVSNTLADPGTLVGIVTFIGAGITLLLSFYAAEQVLKENEMCEELGIVLGACGGTCFRGADLSGANFGNALLKHTQFFESSRRNVILTHVLWQGADGLNRATLGDCILKDRRVRTLLTTPEKGYKQDLTEADLRGANLEGAVLEGAILRRAVLSDANLKKAVLKDAILTEAQAINADFTSACLTGATLEDWEIDGTTVLKNVDYQYVFLREQPNEMGDKKRRPRHPDDMFQPGDFEKDLTISLKGNQ